jgi:hypothetical protein
MRGQKSHTKEDDRHTLPVFWGRRRHSLWRKRGNYLQYILPVLNDRKGGPNDDRAMMGMRGKGVPKEWDLWAAWNGWNVEMANLGESVFPGWFRLVMSALSVEEGWGPPTFDDGYNATECKQQPVFAFNSYDSMCAGRNLRLKAMMPTLARHQHVCQA